MFDESSTPTIYDETYTVPGGGLTSGSPITLPASRTYTGEELEIYLNGQRCNDGEDFQYVGVAPRSQIQFTFDLNAGEKIRFRIDRGA